MVQIYQLHVPIPYIKLLSLYYDMKSRYETKSAFNQRRAKTETEATRPDTIHDHPPTLIEPAAPVNKALLKRFALASQDVPFTCPGRFRAMKVQTGWKISRAGSKASSISQKEN